MARYVRQRKLIQRIESEYDEPIADVLQGFADQGHSRGTVARILEISDDTLQRLAEKVGVQFPHLKMPPRDREWRARHARVMREAGARRRDNHVIEYDGRRAHLSAWAREAGLHPSTLASRIRRGWPLPMALQRKPRHQRGTP